MLLLPLQYLWRHSPCSCPPEDQALSPADLGVSALGALKRDDSLSLPGLERRLPGKAGLLPFPWAVGNEAIGRKTRAVTASLSSRTEINKAAGCQPRFGSRWPSSLEGAQLKSLIKAGLTSCARGFTRERGGRGSRAQQACAEKGLTFKSLSSRLSFGKKGEAATVSQSTRFFVQPHNG